MIRLLLFIDSLGAGGAQRQLTGLACLLKEKGYSVKVATYYDHPFYKYLLDENQVEYECFRVNSKLCLPKLVRCIRRFKADVVISFQTDPNALACIAAKVCGTKLIVSERNTHQEINWKDKIIFQLYRLADYVVPNSYSEKDFIEKHFPHLKSKTQTIPNFVDLKRFSPTDSKEYNQGLLILSVASVKASKNTKNFIKAYHEAFMRVCRAKVIWYGVNPKQNDLATNYAYANECQAMIEELGIGDFFKLMPKRQDIENAYREADIFCLPSHFEGTPNVICEAMASGLPVMASNVCDNPYFVKSEENGWLFDQNNVPEMADVIVNATGGNWDLQAMGKRSRKFAEDLCSEDIFINRYLNLIKAL